MPYFAWKGVDLHARIRKGALFAQNKQDLDEILLKKDIALLSFSYKKMRWQKPISLQAKIDYMIQLAMLMKAGMLLPKALRLVANQTAQPSFAMVAHDIADNVEHGIALTNALQKHSKIFRPLIVQMACVGQESGSLPDTLHVLSGHLEAVAQFKRRLASALLLPLITFGFFLTIICIMLVVIVPQFASIFGSLQKDLPGATKGMLKLSNFLRSGNLVYLAMGLVTISFMVYRYLKTRSGKIVFDAVLMRLPFIRSLIVAQTMAGFFQAVSLLLQGGTPLVKAVTIAKETIDNTVIKKSMESLVQEINAGVALSDALASFERLCPQDMISLIKVGQESSQLAPMLVRIVAIYQQRLIQNLSRINTLFQPFLLIILGLMITGLILALYTPIMSLSYAV